MKQAAYNLRYLAACAVNGIAPEKEIVEAMDMAALYKMSRSHSLSALTAAAISAAGVELSAKWQSARDMSLRKSILFDTERAKLLDFMEQSGIWYLPLKGVFLKDMYPQLGMREMADNDILFDPGYRAQVAEFMKQSGYRVDSYGKTHHDTYFKDPIFNFEMHVSMFSDSAGPVFVGYYEDIKNRLIPIEGKKFGYRMSDEEFYIHMTAHEYVHYSNGGTGLRSLLDRYVYLSAKGNTLDMAAVEAGCRALGIGEFEQDARALCYKVFGNPQLPELEENETEMLEYYMFSTTYGTVPQSIQNRIRRDYGRASKSAKLRYVMRRVFPKAEFYKRYCPVAYKYKILIPAVWFYRLVRALFVRRGRIKQEIDVVSRMEK